MHTGQPTPRVPNHLPPLTQMPNQDLPILPGPRARRQLDTPLLAHSPPKLLRLPYPELLTPPCANHALPSLWKPRVEACVLLPLTPASRLNFVLFHVAPSLGVCR